MVALNPLPHDHHSLMMKTCKTCSSHFSHKVFATTMSELVPTPTPTSILQPQPIQAEVGNIAECQGILAILWSNFRYWSHKTPPRCELAICWENTQQQEEQLTASCKSKRSRNRNHHHHNNNSSNNNSSNSNNNNNSSNSNSNKNNESDCISRSRMSALQALATRSSGPWVNSSCWASDYIVTFWRSIGE